MNAPQPLSDEHATCVTLAGLLGDVAERGCAPIDFVQPSAPSLPVRFPQGASSRRIDRQGRIKFQRSSTLRDLLGWQSGALTATSSHGWLLLSQRREDLGTERGRNSARAGFNIGRDGVERICLGQGHLLHLGVSAGADVLVAPCPAQGVVLVVDTFQILLAAPTTVHALLGGVQELH